MGLGWLRRGGRGIGIITLGLGTVLVVTAACAGYGGETFESPQGGKVQTDGEHCRVTVPQGWTWRPASWTAVSPLGTEMAFDEALYGRPQHPDWEEARDTARRQAEERGATVSERDDGNTLWIDFGEDGGLSFVHRFDRVGCQLTFSNTHGDRAQEQPTWEQIIATLERTTPDD